MSDSQQLREQMWDLVYGLLEADETQSLITRIKSDPQAARLYAEVRLQADLVGYASQVEDASLVLKGDGVGSEVAVTPGKSGKQAAAVAPAEVRSVPRRQGSRAAVWLAGITAAALAALIAVGLFLPQVDQTKLAKGLIVVDVEAPRSLPAGITNGVRLRTEDLRGVAQSARLDVAVVDSQSQQHFYKKLESNSLGMATLEIPGSAISRGAKLQVAAAPLDTDAFSAAQIEDAEFDGSQPVAEDRAQSGTQSARSLSRSSTLLAAELPVQAEPTLAYLLLESPVIEPGQTVQFSLWNISAVTGVPVSAPIAGLAVENAEGLAVAEPTWQFDADTATVNGVVQLPDAADPAELSFSFRSLRGDKVHLPFYALGKTPETLDQAGISKLALAEGLYDSRMRQSAVDRVEQKLAEKQLDAQAGASAGQGLEQKQEALGEVTKESVASKGSDLAENRYYAAPNAYSDLASDGMAPKSGESLRAITVPVPAELADRKALAVVRYGDLPVVMQSLEPLEERENKLGKQSSGPAEMSLRLPPEIVGNFNLQWFDNSADRPRLVAEQTVERETARKLQVQLVEGKSTWQPGEQVALTFQVTDEQGAPAADAQVAVRLWNEQLTAGEPVLLADALGRPSDFLAAPNEDVVALQQHAYRFKRLESLARLQDQVESETEKLKKSLALAPAERVPMENGEEASAARADAKLYSDPFAGGSGGGFGEADEQGEFGRTKEDQTASTMEAFEFQTLATNRPAVEAQFEASLALAKQRRQAFIATIGRILLIGGCGALVLLGLVMLFRMPVKGRLIVPSLAVAALASLLLGMVWICWKPNQNWRQVAFAPADESQSRVDATAATAEPSAAETFGMESATEYSEYSARSSSGTVASDGANESELLGAVVGDEPAHTSSPANAPAEAAPLGATEGVDALDAAPGAPQAAASAPPAAEEPSVAASGPQGIGGAGTRRAVKNPAPRGGEADLAKDEMKDEVRAKLAMDFKQREAGEASSRMARSPATGRKGALRDLEEKNKLSQLDAATPATAGAPAPPTDKAPPLPRPSAPAPAPEASVPKIAAGGIPASDAPALAGSAGLRSKAEPAKNDAVADKRESSRAAGDGEGASRKETRARTFAGGKSEEMDRELADKPVDQKLASRQTDDFAATRGLKSGAPASLYFNPHLTTDSQGLARIEFTMPAVESDYRLLIDAIGNGRVGSAEGLILGRQE